MTIEKGTLGRRRFLGIAAGAAALSRQAQARAPRAVPEQQTFSFAVIADPHCAEGPRKGVEQHGNAVDKLLRCFEKMDALPQADRPDFTLIAGDIHPEALAPHLGKIDCPLHVVAGNHEGSAKTRGLLRSLFPGDFGKEDNERDYYSFAHKGVRFIGLCDAGMGGEHVGQFSSELIRPFGQCDWFERELARQEPRKVVFAHIPPALDGRDRNMYMGRNDSRWFLECVRQTPPDLLFFGHLHRETKTCAIGDAQAVNLRSCCWNFQNAPLGFMLVRVTPDGLQTREMRTGSYKETG